LLRKFPEFTAWGQAIANGESDVTVRDINQLPISKTPRPTRKRRPNAKYAGLEGKIARPVASGEPAV